MKLPPRHLRLRLAKHTRLLYREIFPCGAFTALTHSFIILWKLSFQKAKHVSVDLPEFEEEPVVSVGRWNDDEFRIGDVGREDALFGGGEEAVCFDADDERSGREGGEDGGEGRGLCMGGLRVEVWVGGGGVGGGVGRRRNGGASPSEVMRIHFACDVDVTVGVESGNELGALVAEIGLG